MTKDNIIQMAREAGISDTYFDFHMVSPEDLERFAAIVAAAEREACKAEVETLRAKIEAMEKQEPVAWLHESRRDSDVVTSAVKHVWGKAVVGALAAYSIPLYLAPGAKGEGK